MKSNATTSDAMGLHQFVGGSSGSGYRLLHFHGEEQIFNQLKPPICHLGEVLLSNVVLLSDGPQSEMLIIKSYTTLI